MIDGELNARYQESRQNFINTLIDEDRTPEEAERMVAWMESNNTMLDTEWVKCWKCIMGEVAIPTGMGEEYQRCPKCHGRGRALRFKTPETFDANRKGVHPEG
jgi:hypothetical protein